ncbi:MAG: hypothetical protein K1X89_10055 [Myxococcaceae bacterium]|nr:hypothetical protein [Myxococcaceae bacterium]
MKTAAASSNFRAPENPGQTPPIFDRSRLFPPTDGSYEPGFEPKTGDKDSAAQFEYNLRGKTPKALAELKKYLEARVKDAESGPHKSPEVAKRSREQLKLIAAEEATRKKLGNSTAGKYHRLDTADLKKELARQQERLQEATTGAAQDPKKAAEARKAIAAATSELATRDREAALNDRLESFPQTKPVTPEEMKAFKDGIRSQPNAKQLEAELKRLQAKAKDASSGPSRDKVEAANDQAKARAIEAELAVRKSLEKSSDPKYALKVHLGSDEALKSETAKWKEVLTEATSGADRDPKAAKEAREKLAILDAESQRRAGLTFQPLPWHPAGGPELPIRREPAPVVVPEIRRH